MFKILFLFAMIALVYSAPAELNEEEKKDVEPLVPENKDNKETLEKSETFYRSFYPSFYNAYPANNYYVPTYYSSNYVTPYSYYSGWNPAFRSYPGYYPFAYNHVW